MNTLVVIGILLATIFVAKLKRHQQEVEIHRED